MKDKHVKRKTQTSAKREILREPEWNNPVSSITTQSKKMFPAISQRNQPLSNSPLMQCLSPLCQHGVFHCHKATSLEHSNSPKPAGIIVLWTKPLTSIRATLDESWRRVPIPLKQNCIKMLRRVFGMPRQNWHWFPILLSASAFMRN